MNLCWYHTIKFIPNHSTGEFVILGVMAYLPQTGEVAFKFAPEAFDRASALWNDGWNNLCTAAVMFTKFELDEIKQQVAKNKLCGKELIDFMDDRVRMTPSYVVFSEKDHDLCNDLQEALDELFEEFALGCA
ncbi:MAG: DUF3037 domain-containing protein [Enterovibrio sp.]